MTGVCLTCGVSLVVAEAARGQARCSACDPERSADELMECVACGRTGVHDRVRRGACCEDLSLASVGGTCER